MGYEYRSNATNFDMGTGGTTDVIFVGNVGLWSEIQNVLKYQF
jgi:hypothetical protein